MTNTFHKKVELPDSPQISVEQEHHLQQGTEQQQLKQQNDNPLWQQNRIKLKNIKRKQKPMN